MAEPHSDGGNDGEEPYGGGYNDEAELILDDEEEAMIVIPDAAIGSIKMASLAMVLSMRKGSHSVVSLF